MIGFLQWLKNTNEGAGFYAGPNESFD